MTRYELIMHDAEKMASELPYNEQYPAKCGYLKAEIKHLCNEIETLEERWAATMTACKPGPGRNQVPPEPGSGQRSTG